jgi:DNA-binding NarL/FixJ family response regulator
MSDSTYKIVLADDHRLFREGVRRILQDMKGVEVTAEAADGLELLRLLRRQPVNLVILDISMPQLRGIEAATEIKATWPAVRILILTMHKDLEFLRYALAAGAEGYLLKEDADTELLAAVDAIRQGRTYITPLLAPSLTQDWVAMSRGHQPESEPSLTLRERQVLKLVAEGHSYPEIGELLSISIHTVHSHRANLMRKLGARKSADLVKYAIRKGYVSISE